MLCRFPEHIVCNLLMFWVTERDVARLDSSLCNGTDRLAWFAILRNTMVALNFAAKSVHLSWQLKRQVKFSSCDFVFPVGDDEERAFTAFLESCGSRLKKVRLGGTTSPSDTVRPYFNYLNNAEIVLLRHFVVSVEDLEAVLSLPKVVQLQVHKFSCLSRPVSVCTVRCSALKLLRLPGCGIDDKSLSTIASVTPLLEDVNLCKCELLTDVAARAIAKHWRLLKRACLVHNDFTEVGVIAIARSCTGLESLALAPL